MEAIYGLEKIPDEILLKKSREEIGTLKSEIEFLEAEVQRLKTDLNTKAGFGLTPEQKLIIRTDERLQQLQAYNKKLVAENKKLKHDNSGLLYTIVQLQKTQ